MPLGVTGEVLVGKEDCLLRSPCSIPLCLLLRSKCDFLPQSSEDAADPTPKTSSPGGSGSDHGADPPRRRRRGDTHAGSCCCTTMS